MRSCSSRRAAATWPSTGWWRRRRLQARDGEFQVTAEATIRFLERDTSHVHEVSELPAASARGGGAGGRSARFDQCSGICSSGLLLYHMALAPWIVFCRRPTDESCFPTSMVLFELKKCIILEIHVTLDGFVVTSQSSLCVFELKCIVLKRHLTQNVFVVPSPSSLCVFGFLFRLGLLYLGLEMRILSI